MKMEMETVVKALFTRLGYNPENIHWGYGPNGNLELHGDGVAISHSGNPKYWKVKKYASTGSGDLIPLEEDEWDLPLETDDWPPPSGEF